MDAPEEVTKKNTGTANPLETLYEVSYALHSQSPQEIGGLVAMMFPEPMKLEASCTMTHVIWEVFKEIFSISSIQGVKFHTLALALAEIKKEIWDIPRKDEKLSRSDFEAAGNRLEHAINYMSNTKKHPKAYEEFNHVLGLATKAFYKLDKFLD